jgi:hypothetical protein
MNTVWSLRDLRIAVVFVALGTLGCTVHGPSEVDVNPEVSLAAVPMAISAAPVVAALAVTVSAADIDPALVFNVDLVNGSATDTITVPAGRNRVIDVRGFGADGMQTHFGSKTTDLVAGLNPPLTIVLEGLTGEQPVIVSLGALTVTVEGSVSSVVVSSTAQLSAVVLDEVGDALPVTVRWASSNPAIATVDETGLVTGITVGTADIVATYAGFSGARTITVTQN